MNMPPPPPPPPPPPYGGGYIPEGTGGPMGVGQILSRGWATFKSRLPDFVKIAVIVGVINGVLGFALSRGDNISRGRLGLVALIGFVVSIVGSLITTRIALAAVDGDATPFAGLSSQAMARAGGYLGWTLLTGLIVAVGLVLCILPGLAAAFFLCLVPFAAMEGRSGTSPLSASYNAVKEKAGEIILVFLVFIGIAIVVAIVAGILGFIPLIGNIIGSALQFAVTSFGLCAFATIYRNSSAGRVGAR